MYRTRRSLRFNPLGRQHFSLHHHERFSYDEMEAYRKKAWQTYREAQTRLTLRGVAVFAFCRTTLTQGFHLRAEMVTTLSLAFEDAPTPPGLQVVSRALKCMVNVTDLTVTGLANPEEDGWILRHCGFVLQRFATDLLLHSMDLLDFLERQNRILELKITNRTILPGFVLPRDILPDLKVLECPDTGINCFVGKMDDVPRPIKDIRLKLDADYIGKRDKALRAVSRFDLTLKYFSLDFEGEAVDVYAEYFDIPDIINQLGKLSNWPELRFLEFCGGHFDEVSVIGFVQSIVNNFAEVDSLLWAPTSVEKNTPEWIARTLYRGSPSLRYFGYLDPTSVDAQRTVRCVQYARLGEEGITREEHRVLMDGE